MLRNRHYKEAHNGDLISAFLLIDEIIKDYQVFKHRSCFVCPVQKKTGNKIPLALATRIVQNSNSTLCDSVFLLNCRPGNSMIERMFFEPDYSGQVPIGNYMLIDDVFTTGSTLRGLKTFIELNGGNVITAFTLGSSKSLLFDASNQKIKILKSRYPDIEKYFDVQYLTVPQIDYLLHFSSLSNFHNLYAKKQLEKQFY